MKNIYTVGLFAVILAFGWAQDKDPKNQEMTTEQLIELLKKDEAKAKEVKWFLALQKYQKNLTEDDEGTMEISQMSITKGEKLLNNKYKFIKATDLKTRKTQTHAVTIDGKGEEISDEGTLVDMAKSAGFKLTKEEQAIEFAELCNKVVPVTKGGIGGIHIIGGMGTAEPEAEKTDDGWDVKFAIDKGHQKFGHIWHLKVNKDGKLTELERENLGKHGWKKEFEFVPK